MVADITKARNFYHAIAVDTLKALDETQALEFIAPTACNPHKTYEEMTGILLGVLKGLDILESAYRTQEIRKHNASNTIGTLGDVRYEVVSKSTDWRSLFIDGSDNDLVSAYQTFSRQIIATSTSLFAAELEYLDRLKMYQELFAEEPRPETMARRNLLQPHSHAEDLE